MNQYTTKRSVALIVAGLASLGLLLQPILGQTVRPRRIAVFGSSVANGTGDELRKEGYTGRLREVLAPRGWEVLNQSRGGDNTRTLAARWAPEGTPNPQTRYLLPVNPGYVVFGLSLGNEGIANAAGRVEKDAIFKQFETGMRALVERSRQHNMVPIVTLCYTRNDFTGVEYEYTRRMNLAINSWDVPSVNFLGAVDDGHGRWAEGFWNDALHPNASGHFELLTTFVPTLFDALDRGKPTPVRATGSGFVRVTAGPAALSYAPEGTMHPFAVGLTTRASSNAQLATVEGRLLKAISQGRNVIFQAGERATAGILVQDGVFAYRSTAGELIKSTVAADASWHQVVLSHYTARGETLLFVDGTLAVSVRERLETSRIVVGPTATTSSKPVDVKDFLVYRSALNADEVAALKKGTLVQASLDVYAPLADASLARGAALENRAQSLAALRVGEGSLTHLDR